jgi:hypothetical protein
VVLFGRNDGAKVLFFDFFEALKKKIQRLLFKIKKDIFRQNKNKMARIEKRKISNLARRRKNQMTNELSF